MNKTNQRGAGFVSIEDIAEVCHETNRVYCETLNDYTQVPWSIAPQWQKDSAIEGVRFHIANPYAEDAASHESWLLQKQRDGWVYGEVKDPDKKQHPCMVLFDELPIEQQVKDKLFAGICRAMIPMLVDTVSEDEQSPAAA